MRYGIVRSAESLPAPTDQREILESHGCETVIEEPATGPMAAKRLERLIPTFEAGDELMLPGLDVFLMTTADIAMALQDLLEANVVIKIATGPSTATEVRPGDPSAQIICALADHERRRPSRSVPENRPRGAGGSRNPLSRYQIEYARKLYARGTPLRAIGLLFQVSPDTIWKLVGGFSGLSIWAAAVLPGL